MKILYLGCISGKHKGGCGYTIKNKMHTFHKNTYQNLRRLQNTLIDKWCEDDCINCTDKSIDISKEYWTWMQQLG